MSSVTLLCGPPCSGKSTLARELAEPGDTVLDFDTIARQLGSPRGWQHPAPIITAAHAIMQRSIVELAERIERGEDVTAWVIRAAPQAAMRERYARALGARVWLLDPGKPECLRRARARPYGTAQEIHKWYRLYRPSPLDDLRAGDHGGEPDGAGSP